MGMPSQLAREMNKVLVDLGYWLERRDGAHLVYRHARHPQFVVPGTPSDNRTKPNLMAELKRRHPAQFQQRKSRRPRKRRRSEAERNEAHLQAVLNAAERNQPPPVVVPIRPDRTQCASCGRLWISDYDPTGRPCPECGGEILIGRNRPWEAA